MRECKFGCAGGGGVLLVGPGWQVLGPTVQTTVNCLDSTELYNIK